MPQKLKIILAVTLGLFAFAAQAVVVGGWGIPTLIETDNTGGAYSPQIALDANGNAIAVWAQHDSTCYNVWARHYSLPLIDVVVCTTKTTDP